jgi:hypothetical protein
LRLERRSFPPLSSIQDTTGGFGCQAETCPVDFAATPLSLVLVWAADGTDFIRLAEWAELVFEHGWSVLRAFWRKPNARCHDEPSCRFPARSGFSVRA